MIRNRFSLGLLLLFIVTMIVSPAAAQSAKDIDLGEVISNLGPRDGYEIFDVFLYVIFFVGLITMGLIPEKQLFASLLNMSVIGMAIISKLLVGDTVNTSAILAPDHFATFALNAGMFVVPFIVAGLVRSHKGKPSKAIMPAIFMGIVGGAYFFLFWSQKQNDYIAPTRENTNTFLQIFL